MNDNIHISETQQFIQSNGSRVTQEWGIANKGNKSKIIFLGQIKKINSIKCCPPDDSWKSLIDFEIFFELILLLEKEEISDNRSYNIGKKGIFLEDFIKKE